MVKTLEVLSWLIMSGIESYIYIFNSHKFNKKQKIMKKHFLTVATVALFAIGFAASDEEESSNSSSSSSEPQTEQKQETEAERKAREKKEESERKEREQKEKQAKYDEMMKDAYEFGKKQGMQFTYYHECNGHFTAYWFTPSTDEEFEIFRKYKEEYDRGFEEGHKAKERMNNM